MASPCLLAWLLVVLGVFPAHCRSVTSGRSVSSSDRSVSSSDRSELQRLYTALAERAPSMRHVLPPGRAAGAPVEVSVHLVLNYVTVVSDDIVDVDGWLTLNWNDPRLGWNREDYNVTDIRLPQDMIWTPDITSFDNIDIRQRTMEKFLAAVYQDGQVNVINKMTLRLPCADDGSGRRTCVAKFGSWMYSGFLLDLKRETSFDLSEYKPSKHYQVTNGTATRNVQQYDCCPEPYPDMIFTFDLERK